MLSDPAIKSPDPLLEVALAMRLLPPDQVIARYSEDLLIAAVYRYFPHLVRQYLDHGHRERDGSPCQSCRGEFRRRYLMGEIFPHN